MAYYYNFPAIAGDFAADDVLAKIQEELGEFQAEIGIYSFTENYKEFDRLNVKAVMELLDVIHACETMLRLFDNDVLVDAAHFEVVRKNDERGYYVPMEYRFDMSQKECGPDCPWLNSDTNRCDRRAEECEG